MTTILLITSVFSMVFRNAIMNNISKKNQQTKGNVYLFNFYAYVVCITIFGILSVFSGFSWFTIGIGLLFGIITVLSNVYVMLALSEGPMHITLLITTSSMIIPALSGVVMFDEDFSIYKLIAIIFLIVFIYFSVNYKNNGKTFNRKWLFFSLVAFITQGMVGVIQKIHQSSVHRTETASFLAIAFICSIIFSGFVAKKENNTLKHNNIHLISALICGFCIVVMNYFNLKLSGILPSQIFFPTVNGSAIVLSAIVSVVIFKERISRLQTFGLIGGIASLIAICLLP